VAHLHTPDKYNIDDGLVEIRAINDANRKKKSDAMKSAAAAYHKKQAGIHSHNYQPQDAIIKEYAALSGHRAPGTYLHNRTGLKVFCINCGVGHLYKSPRVSGSGRLTNRQRCRCGENTTVILKRFVKHG
jgi:hypothetical protein